MAEPKLTISLIKQALNDCPDCPIDDPFYMNKVIQEVVEDWKTRPTQIIFVLPVRTIEYCGNRDRKSKRRWRRNRYRYRLSYRVFGS